MPFGAHRFTSDLLQRCEHRCVLFLKTQMPNAKCQIYNRPRNDLRSEVCSGSAQPTWLNGSGLGFEFSGLW